MTEKQTIHDYTVRVCKSDDYSFDEVFVPLSFDMTESTVLDAVTFAQLWAKTLEHENEAGEPSPLPRGENLPIVWIEVKSTESKLHLEYIWDPHLELWQVEDFTPEEGDRMT